MCTIASYTAVALGGNWSSNVTWGGAGHPVAGDTAIINATMVNTVTVDAASACTTLDMTGNAGTLALGSQTLTVSGGATLQGAMTNTSGVLSSAGGVTLAGTPTGTLPVLNLSASQTFTSAGFSYPGTIAMNLSNATLTLADLLTCGKLCILARNITTAGPFGITCDNLVCTTGSGAGVFTMVSGQTLNVNTSLNISSNATSQGVLQYFVFSAVTASSPFYLNYLGTPANCKLVQTTFTDVDASGSARAIDNWYGQTLTRTTNIINRTSADIGGGWIAGE
jgi:hypothetical protein